MLTVEQIRVAVKKSARRRVVSAKNWREIAKNVHPFTMPPLPIPDGWNAISIPETAIDSEADNIDPVDYFSIAVIAVAHWQSVAAKIAHIKSLQA